MYKFALEKQKLLDLEVSYCFNPLRIYSLSVECRGKTLNNKMKNNIQVVIKQR